MSNTTQTVLGSVVALWRYPVKSMMGEELNAAEVTARGLLGDRAYALMDPSTGKLVSVKHPRKWGKLFDCRAAFVEPPSDTEKLPPVRITLPDGAVVQSDREDINELLSGALGRQVALVATPPERLRYDMYWPEMEGLTPAGKPVPDESGDTITRVAAAVAAPGTFFDIAALHVLTTATIERLRELYPKGRFEVRRFRPNIVLEPVSADKSFVENAWIGHSLTIGDAVQLTVTDACVRCVMTTLAQGDLPHDSGILRVAAQHNLVRVAYAEKPMPGVGVYASVLQRGMIRRGDPARLAEVASSAAPR